MEEQILVIQANNPFCSFQGFRPANESWEFIGTLNTDPGFWVTRTPSIEENPRFKQIVAVAMLVTKDLERVFSYRRFSQVDPRLNGFHSILVGGHVELSSDKNHSFWFPLEACLAREVREEVSVTVLPEQLRFLGCINSMTTSISKFHLGVLFRVIVEPEQVRPKEHGIREGRMALISSPFPQNAEVDGWSQIAHQVLIDLAQARTPS